MGTAFLPAQPQEQHVQGQVAGAGGDAILQQESSKSAYVLWIERRALKWEGKIPRCGEKGGRFCCLDSVCLQLFQPLFPVEALLRGLLEPGSPFPHCSPPNTSAPFSAIPEFPSPSRLLPSLRGLFPHKAAPLQPVSLPAVVIYPGFSLLPLHITCLDSSTCSVTKAAPA